VARGDCKADLVVQLARGRDVAVLLNVEPQTGLAQRCGATIRIFGAGDNCNPGITGCAGWGGFVSESSAGSYSRGRLDDTVQAFVQTVRNCGQCLRVVLRCCLGGALIAL
jgi:hypothetical protein